MTEIQNVRGLAIHQHKGRSGLRLVCQLCNKFIEKGNAGLFVWNPDGDEVLAVHKTCNMHQGDPYLFTEEVDTGLMYLLWNTGVRGEAMKRANEKAESLMSL